MKSRAGACVEFDVYQSTGDHPRETTEEWGYSGGQENAYPTVTGGFGTPMTKAPATVEGLDNSRIEVASGMRMRCSWTQRMSSRRLVARTQASPRFNLALSVRVFSVATRRSSRRLRGSRLRPQTSWQFEL